MKDFTGATACYIGQHVTPLNKVEDGDDETAHVNEGVDKILMFGQSTAGHEYLIDQTMTMDQGLTFDVFKDPEPVEGEVEEAAPIDEEEEEGS